MGLDAASVVRAVHDQWETECAGCSARLVGHEVVLGLLLGHKTSLACVECLARPTGCTPDEYVRYAAQNIRRLDCYRAGWNAADARLRAEDAWPHPRIPTDIEMPPDDDGDIDETELEDAAVPPTFLDAAQSPPAATPPAATATWDAGSMSCGDLVLELRLRMNDLAPGTVLRVRATDPGAPDDLPAWCRLTGHGLLHTDHPEYWIRRRD